MNSLWNNLSYLGVKQYMPIEKTRKVILTNQVAYVSFCILLFLNSSFLFVDTIKFDPVGFSTVPLVLITPLLNKYGYYKISSFSITILMPFAALIFSSYSKTLMPPPIPLLSYILPKLMLLSFLILPYILIDSKNKGLLIIAIIINIACLLLPEKVNELMGVGIDFKNISYENYNRINTLIIFPISVILLGFTFLISINNKYVDRIIKQNENLEDAYLKIERINNNLTDSILYAKHIQSAVLPNKKLFKQYFNDSFIYYKAKDMVSGDFYFLKEINHNDERCLAIAVSDCTGHGVPGGFMSMLGITVLTEIIKENTFLDAADVLNQLRSNVKNTLNQTGKISEQPDGMDIAFVLYYPNSNKLEYSGAVNPIYIVDKHKKLTIYKADKMPIGVYIKEQPFTNTVIHLEGGEMLYLFTDGITDQPNKNRQKFSSVNLRKILLDIHTEPCAKQQTLFSEKMQNWLTNDEHKPIEQIDDMLLIGVKLC